MTFTNVISCGLSVFFIGDDKKPDDAVSDSSILRRAQSDNDRTRVSKPSDRHKIVGF